MAIKYIFSNDISTLRIELFKRLRDSNKDIFSNINIIVPNLFIEKWLKKEIANYFGIFFNIRIDTPTNIFTKVISSIFGDIKLIDSSENDIRMLIFKILIDNIDNSDINSFKNYFCNEKRGGIDYKKLFKLTDEIAKYFIEYFYQIPEVIDKWDKNKFFLENDNIEKAFSLIYKEIFKKYENKYTTLKKLSEELTLLPQENIKNKILFDKIYIFGFSYIPYNQYLFIESLSRYIEVDLFMIKYSISDNSFVKKYTEGVKKIFKTEGLSDKACIEEINNYNYQSGLLGELKKSFFENKRENITKQDRTLQIIECPSYRREVETVYQSILYNLREDPSLKLDDICVLVTRPDDYYTHIFSVFENQDILKYQIRLKRYYEPNIIKALKDLIKLINSDYRKDKVISLLSNPVIASRFDFSDEDINELIKIIDRVKIYFSYNKEDKIRYSNWDSDYFTWSFGLKKIRNSYMIGNNVEDLDEIISCSDYYIRDSENIESLNLFFENLFGFLNSFENEMDPQEFKNRILYFIYNFTTVKDREEEYVKTLIESKLYIFDEMKKVFSAKVSIDYLKEYAISLLNSIKINHKGGISEGIIIKNLYPMESIPFKIIYIMGLDEDFPSRDLESSIDFKIKVKDYVKKSQMEKYAFLEALLSAQKKIYITYRGKDIEKDQIIYYSPIVKDIINYLGIDFKVFSVPINIEDIIKSGNYTNNPYTDIYHFITEKEIQKSNNLNPVNTIKINFVGLNKDDLLIDLKELINYAIYSPKKALLEKKCGVDMSFFNINMQNSIEPFFDYQVINDYIKVFIINLLLGDDIEYQKVKILNYFEKIIEKKLVRGELTEGFYSDFIKEFFKNKIEEYCKALENKEKLIEIVGRTENNSFNKDNFIKNFRAENFKKVLIDQQINIEELNINGTLKGKIKNCYIKGHVDAIIDSSNRAYLFEIIDDIPFYSSRSRSPKKGNIKEGFVNILVKSLIYNCLLKKKGYEASKILFFEDKKDKKSKKLYIFLSDSFEKIISNIFNTLISNYIDDILETSCLYEVDKDVLIKDFILEGKSFEFEEYKRIVIKNKNYYYQSNFWIKDEDILINTVNIFNEEKVKKFYDFYSNIFRSFYREKIDEI